MFSVSVLARAVPFACVTGLLISTASVPVNAQRYDRPFSWTGFYVGGHTGYSWTDIEFPGAAPYVAPPAPCGGCGPPRQELHGAFLGGQVGANYQMGAIVVGVEADLSKANLNGSVRDGNYIVQTDTIELTGSLRGRLGYAIGPFLPYATAGVLWERSVRGQSCPGDPAAVVAGHCKTAGPYDLSDTQTHHGFVWGGGVEYAINHHWSLKMEAMRASLGEQIYVLAPDAKGNIANVSKIEHETTTVRFGMNYRF
jgi:opacity protein-like surface antigen